MTLSVEEWLTTAGQPDLMIDCIPDISLRKLRLLTCELARRHWHLLTDPASRAAVEVAERFADGRATEQERAAARALAGEARQSAVDRRDDSTNNLTPEAHAACIAEMAVWDHTREEKNDDNIIFPFDDSYYAAADPRRELAAMADLLRCVFGHPLRPVAFDPAWRTPTAVALAAGMYESRDFGPMPVLADALYESGCAQSAVLTHCRGPGPHTRGCWVIDFVLGKH